MAVMFSPAAAQPAVPPSSAAIQDVDKCVSNLRAIYDAIQSYKADHQDLPNSLADLIPDYISDKSVFVCPADHSPANPDGSSSTSRPPNSYVYEFKPVPLGPANFPEAPQLTLRDWRLKQMDIAGRSVPLVRCFHHGSVLNLGVDGKIYESSIVWESALGGQIDVSTLTPESLYNKGSNLEPVKTLTKLELYAYALQEATLEKNAALAQDHHEDSAYPGETDHASAVQGWNPYRKLARWWPLAAATTSCVLLVIAFFMNRVREPESLTVMKPDNSNGPQGTYNQEQVRAGMFGLMRTALFQRLFLDRAQLLAAQRAAAEKVMELDQRFNSLEKQVILSKEYEKRIDALLVELSCAREENRELIQSKIDEIKLEMEKQTPKSMPYQGTSTRN
jgi:hypothetical protein